MDFELTKKELRIIYKQKRMALSQDEVNFLSQKILEQFILQFNVIENDSLQNLILDLYQNRIASLKLTTSYITNFKTQQLLPFLSKNIRYNADNTSNFQQVVEMPEMQNYLLLGGFGQEAMERYHAIIDESEKIIDLINKQYKN